MGLHDSFVDLGGDSLSAVAIFAGIEQAFGVAFPLATLFRVPTVAGLADALEHATRRSPAPGTVHDRHDGGESHLR